MRVGSHHKDLIEGMLPRSGSRGCNGTALPAHTGALHVQKQHSCSVCADPLSPAAGRSPDIVGLQSKRNEDKGT